MIQIMALIFLKKERKVKIVAMKFFKTINELPAISLEFLYKDIRYNWSNNVRHEAALTDVVFKDDETGEFHKETVVITKTPIPDEHIFITTTIDPANKKKEPVIDQEDFKSKYFASLDQIKSSVQ